MSKRKGFTLIELLVVIAIIAILAAILFPVFVSTREKGKQVKCQSNLKQLGSGLVLYVQDWNERVPGLPDWGRSGTGHWPFALMPYVKNKKVFVCPTDAAPNNIPFWDKAPGSWHVTYGVNAWFWGNMDYSSGWNYTSTPCPGVAMTNVKAPSRTVFLVCHYVHRPNFWNSSAGFPPNDCRLPAIDTYNRPHMGNRYGMAAFCDGHVKVCPQIPAAPNGDYDPATYTRDGMTMDPKVQP